MAAPACTGKLLRHTAPPTSHLLEKLATEKRFAMYVTFVTALTRAICLKQRTVKTCTTLQTKAEGETASCPARLSQKETTSDSS